MGLADNYKETLKAQGYDVKVESYKKPKTHIKLIIFAIVVVIAVPASFFIFNNFNSCQTQVAQINNQNQTAISTSFSLKCATNTSLYSVAMVIAIAIAILLFLKIIGRTKIKL